MAFNLPPLRLKAEGPVRTETKQGEYGMPDPMIYGVGSMKATHFSHPLEFSEKNYGKNQEKMNLALMRNVQGLHAPLRVAMELKAFEHVGRLPFLASSDLHRDVLLGTEEQIEFSDFLNVEDFKERRPNPHAFMEHKLGLL